MGKKLIIVLGPTAVGKTDYSISLARKYGSPIISCDSRQIFREMRIGTAVPSDEQLEEVRHYFIRTKSVTEYYTAGKYEIEALDLIEKLFEEGHDTLIATGGSMFYIDALCNGIPAVPDADPDLRRNLQIRLSESGLYSLAAELKKLDPLTYSIIDLSNGQRVLRALEVCISTGRPFSSFRLSKPRERSFEIQKIGLMRPREELYSRINDRVLRMMDEGLLEEVRSLNEFRNLTALKTVGYKEIFNYLDSPESVSLDRTVEAIQTNTRHYAKKQLTWWRGDDGIEWINL